MRIEEIAAAEPMTEENEQELARLARRYVAVARLLRQRDELRAEVADSAAARLEVYDRQGAELERLRAIEQRAIRLRDEDTGGPRSGRPAAIYILGGE